MIAEGALIEHACYVNNYYGTPMAYVEEELAKGHDVILEIEIQGARKIKEQYPDAVLLFVSTKDAKTLKERLEGRGTESPEVIAQRLARAVQESEGMEEYDYDVLEECVEQVHGIIEGEHRKMEHNKERIEKIRQDLKGFAKGE